MQPSMDSDVEIIEKIPPKENWQPCVVEEEQPATLTTPKRRKRSVQNLWHSYLEGGQDQWVLNQ
jgi:hypothetical protein